MLTYMTRQS